MSEEAVQNKLLRALAESECSRLARRVEELEKMLFHAANLDRYELIPSCAVCVRVAEFIAKYPSSLNPADSSARITSDPATKEIRRSE